MITLIRTFHPVGQGAFYSEEFLDESGEVVFRAVYDCGCINRRNAKKHGTSVVRKDVRKWGGPHGKRIDYLFISHFDYDHVSLLRELLAEKVAVGVVILPLLHQNDKKLYVQLFKKVYAKTDAAFLSKLIEEPSTVFAPGTAVVHVRANALSGEDVPSGRIDKTRESMRFDVRKINHGAECPDKVPPDTIFPVDADGIDGADWCYVPRNLECPARLLLLAKQFDHVKSRGSLAMFQGLMKNWTGRGFGTLKKAYDKLPGGINSNSMVVYSGPEKGVSRWFLDSFSSRKCNLNHRGGERVLSCAVRNCSGSCSRKFCRPACIFTGDVNLAQFKIKDEFASHLKFVGTIQVPHHGSCHSFSPDIFEGGYYVCPISCSNASYYGHPDASVTNQLVYFGSFPIRVTENQPCEQRIYKF